MSFEKPNVEYNATKTNNTFIIPPRIKMPRRLTRRGKVVNLYKNYFLETIQDASTFQDKANSKDESIEEDIKQGDK